MASITDRLKESGFKVEAIDFEEKLGTELFQRYALPKGEILYVCSK